MTLKQTFMAATALVAGGGVLYINPFGGGDATLFFGLGFLAVGMYIMLNRPVVS